jgi:hypothetical protein
MIKRCFNKIIGDKKYFFCQMGGNIYPKRQVDRLFQSCVFLREETDKTANFHLIIVLLFKRKDCYTRKVLVCRCVYIQEVFRILEIKFLNGCLTNAGLLLVFLAVIVMKCILLSVSRRQYAFNPSYLFHL